MGETIPGRVLGRTLPCRPMGDIHLWTWMHIIQMGTLVRLWHLLMSHLRYQCGRLRLPRLLHLLRPRQVVRVLSQVPP